MGWKSRPRQLECSEAAALKIAVVGMWHLGTVTAACLASAGHDVTGIDEDAEVINQLGRSRLPVNEPGLEDLTREQIASGRLRFTTDFQAVSGNEIVWIAYDTPVDENDNADVEFVIQRIERLFSHLPDGAIVLISSQMPVGSTAKLERLYRESGFHTSVSFAYSPENLRLGRAIEVFTKPDRIVAGVRNERDRARLASLFAAFTDNVEWMSIESAEMTKHALNAFLATSVAFINEIAAVCEKVGADAAEVERGLKSDIRIGRRSYLHAGGAFAGGTLARDIAFLRQKADDNGLALYLIDSVRRSNDAHKGWVRRCLLDAAGSLRGKTVAVLGLTYKPGTNTLRRSTSVETCRWLAEQGARVQAFDPAVTELPAELTGIIEMQSSDAAALRGADALLVATEWPQFRSLRAEDVMAGMRNPMVLDPARFLESALGHDRRIRYFGIGTPAPSAAVS